MLSYYNFFAYKLAKKILNTVDIFNDFYYNGFVKKKKAQKRFQC